MVYYIGIGLWKNESLHTFNQSQQRILNLEMSLRTCSQIPNVYVVGLFDCCRQITGGDNSQANVRTNNFIVVYRDDPSPRPQAILDPPQTSLLDLLIQQKLRTGRSNILDCTKMLQKPHVVQISGWDEGELQKA